MCQTLGAYRNLPGRTRKPCKLGGWRSEAAAPAYLTEASDFKDETTWIGKGMSVGSIDGNTCIRFRNFLAALPAIQPAVIMIESIVQCYIFRIFLLDRNALILVLLFPKVKNGCQDRSDHIVKHAKNTSAPIHDTRPVRPVCQMEWKIIHGKYGSQPGRSH